MSSQIRATGLPEAANVSDDVERHELIEVVYRELRHLAANYLRNERADHTLQPTALVHEAYLRLAAQTEVKWRNRDHVIGVAAAMMRRVLVDHSRAHKRKKRGRGEPKLPLVEAERSINSRDVDLVQLDEALKKLSEDYPRESQIVELRFFGGLSIADTARLLEMSDSTVERGWKFARAWLQRELNEGEAG